MFVHKVNKNSSDWEWEVGGGVVTVVDLLFITGRMHCVCIYMRVSGMDCVCVCGAGNACAVWRCAWKGV